VSERTDKSTASDMRIQRFGIRNACFIWTVAVCTFSGETHVFDIVQGANRLRSIIGMIKKHISFLSAVIF